MKIAFVRTASNILKYGGYNIQEIGLAKALLEYGVSTDIYARFSNIEETTEIITQNNARVTLHPLKGTKIYREIMYYPSLNKDLCNGGYDMVQLLDDSQMMLPFIFRNLKKKGVKTILWQGMYRNFPGKAARAMQFVYDSLCAKMLNKHSDLKIAKTDEAKRYLESKKYTNTIVLSVGLDKVEPTVDQELDTIIGDFKSKYKKVLLYVGAIEPRRNVDYIVDIFSELNDPEVGLIIVGKGPSRLDIVNKVRKLNLTEKCLMFEQIPNNQLVSIYSRSDIFLLPTNYEIYGMVVMEALTFGIPVIATNEAGPNYILKDIRLGKCLPLNKKQWKDTIRYYLENHKTSEDKKYRSKYVETNFCWKDIAEKYYSIIKELIGNKKNFN